MPLHSQPVSTPDIYQSLNLDRTQPTSALYSQVTSGIQQLVAQGTPESDYTLQLARYAEQVLRDEASRSAYEQSLGSSAQSTNVAYTVESTSASSSSPSDDRFLRIVAWILVGLSFGGCALGHLFALGNDDNWTRYEGYFSASSTTLILVGIYGLVLVFISGDYGSPGSRPGVIVGAVILFLFLGRRIYIDLDQYFNFSGRYGTDYQGGATEDWSFTITVIFLPILATQLCLLSIAVIAGMSRTMSSFGSK